ncbi:MAG TPA: hypothetical protein VLF94_08375 [Chlamydiales bacterium]|nr:hypothetical protein [Chlamydiales bacterium]
MRSKKHNTLKKKAHVTFSIPEKKMLKKAYAAANEDSDRKEVLDDWSVLDKEGWDE